MNIHEHQAKQILKKYGAIVPEGIFAFTIEELVKKAKSVKGELQSLGIGRILFENSGNFGKSYRRHDEVGTPLCVTVDFQTQEDNTVTVRDRDTMKQIRLPTEEVAQYLKEYLN